MKKMIVLDGNSIMFRAYYATAYTGNLMQARSGLYTNAIYGFVNMIQHILQTKDMTNIFVAFDKGKKTLRHQTYSDYKGGRKPTPEEFLMQIPYIKEYLDVLGIKHLELDDYEADDIVGSMAMLARNEFDEVMVISGDKDLLQLAKGNVHVYLTKKGLTDLECYTEENFKSLMGIESYQMTDYKGLIGDSSDNLPGVSGIGPKTAAKLLEEYGTLENIIANIPSLKGKVQASIINDQEQALRCKKLATLYLDVDLPYSVNDTLYVEPKKEVLREFYEKVEFKSFIKKLGDITEEKTVVKSEKLELEYYYNEVDSLISELKKTDKCLLDVEIPKENYHKEEILGISVVINNKGYFIDKSLLNNSGLISELKNKELYTIDVKKVYVSLKKLGVILSKFSFDLGLAAYIVNPSYSSVDAKSMYEKFIETTLPYLEEVYGKNAKYEVPSVDVYGKYSIDKVSYLETIKSEIDGILTSDQKKLLYEVEIPLAVVLGDMELNGFRISKNRLNEIGEFVLNEINRLEKEIYELCGFEFNISSPKQLGEVLFEKLAIAKGKKNKTGYVTNAETLEKLAEIHPVPMKVLEYRKYSKLYSTYVVGLLDMMFDDGKVHTIFKQSLTLTGRLSSVEPNIQNIPIRTEDGRLIRSAFIPSDDSLLISADYSQIELRILAHVSKCKNMIDAFNSGEDLHSSTAAKIYNVDISNVTKDQRRMAKAVNFGIVYGMSPWGLAEELKITTFEANDFINRYFSIYPEVKDYLDKTVNNTKTTGYTETIFGRRRYMPEINSSNGALRQFAERTAKNAPIQGAAADVIKIAMIAVDKKFKELNLSSKLIAQVHDELVVDTKISEVEIVKKILKEVMEGVVSLDVVLEASLSWGENWNMK
ncbi:MAG: DNA polymerase I [Erysipelotrichaceae bacterium]|nr:DNA polymerase I [Erysipelotrichaceae bacterium]